MKRELLEETKDNKKYPPLQSVNKKNRNNITAQLSFSLGPEDPEHRISDPGSEIRILGLGFSDLNARYLKRNHFAFMLYLR